MNKIIYEIRQKELRKLALIKGILIGVFSTIGVVALLSIL